MTPDTPEDVWPRDPMDSSVLTADDLARLATYVQVLLEWDARRPRSADASPITNGAERK
jgi:hypothetical protein